MRQISSVSCDDREDCGGRNGWVCGACDAQLLSQAGARRPLVSARMQDKRHDGTVIRAVRLR